MFLVHEVKLHLDIDQVWQRIKNHSGDMFKTITGLDFTYEIGTSANILIPSRTDYNISKSDAEKVLDRVPLKGPGEISDDVRGSSYLWAILHDSRISNDEW